MQQWVPLLLVTYIRHCQHYVAHISMEIQQCILFSIAVDLTTFCQVYTSLDIATAPYLSTQEGYFMANLLWLQQWKFIQSSCKVPNVCV